MRFNVFEDRISLQLHALTLFVYWRMVLDKSNKIEHDKLSLCSTGTCCVDCSKATVVLCMIIFT